MTPTITPEALERAYQAAKKEWCGLHGSDGQALRAAILAAIPELQAAPAAAGVPDGYVLMPRDPVAALPMLHALADAAGLDRLPDPDNAEGSYTITGQQSTVRRWYDALIAAAAQPQAEQHGAACRKCGGTGEVEVPMPINGCETDTTVIGCDDCADSALAARQPVGEPVAWYYGFSDTGEAGPVTFGGNPGVEAIAWAERHGHTLHYLYTAPPAAVDLEALSVLIAHAEGKIQHHNNGLCPDRLEGHDIRDPACTVCNALIDSKAVRNG